MPTPEVTPIPGLCVSQTNLTTFINNLNLSFDLMVQTINEELGVSLTLPGIPPIPLAGMPSITIPKFEALDINRRFMKQPGLRGYVGNVFPVSQGGKGLGGKYTLPGYPGFFVEGFQGQIPGIDPSTYIINLLNQNYQILVQQLAEEGVTVEVTTIPQLDLCGPDNTQGGQQPGGSGTSPGATTVVNIVNHNNQTILDNLGVCVFGSFQPFTDFQDPGPVTAGDTAWSVTNEGGSSTFIPIGSDSFQWTNGDAFGEIDNFNTTTGTFYDTVRQPKACEHGFHIDWSIVITGSFGSGGPATGDFLMEVYSVLPDNTETLIDTVFVHGVVDVGVPYIDSGTLTIPPGDFPTNATIGLHMEYDVGPGDITGSSLSATITLVDDGL